MRDRVVVGALQEKDLAAAALIVRRAFGTFMGVPDLERFWTDRDYVHGRFRSPHVASFAAVLDGELVGSNFATRWGSVGVLGPITVRTDLWDKGIAQQLMRPVLAQFDAWQVRCSGLFTFAESPRHVGLYEKFGFYARFLTALMVTQATERAPGAWHRFGLLSSERQAEALRGCRAIADALFAGLDLSAEIEAVRDLGLGDTVIVVGDSGVSGFAICHWGPPSEAGADTCLIKFAAVRPGPEAAQAFDRLVDACSALAVEARMPVVMAGMNLGRPEAYRQLKERGFRAVAQGVAMHRPNEPGYSRPGAYIIDDWR